MLSTPSYEEHTLVRALAEGDRHAFTTLYTRHLDAVTQYIYLFTASREAAEEVVQDVFLKIWEKRTTLAELGSFKAYLFRAAKNQLINHLRREQVRVRVTGELYEAGVGAVNSEDTQHQVDYRRAQGLLREAVDGLPPRRKQVFLLSTEEGLSLDDIATRLGISKNVVKKQLYEAYGTMRDYLTAHGELSAYLILLLTLLQA